MLFFFENCEYSKIFLFILVNTIYTTRLKLIFLKILVFFLIRIKKSTFFFNFLMKKFSFIIYETL